MDKAKLLLVAKNAACQAGTILKEDNHRLKYVHLEVGRDIKIEADTRSEEMIIDILSAETRFSILSEERGLVAGEDNSYTWIVDPVDGSLNYSREMPMCCVSIGLWEDDEPILGVIYDFTRAELFCGVADRGAWLNDKPIQVSPIIMKHKAILLTGFPIKMDFTPESINNFIENIQEYKKVRLLGSAALSLAYVAAGRAEAYYEKDIMVWDVAAGIPIVLGAGGKIDKFEKMANAHSYNVYVSNGSMV